MSVASVRPTLPAPRFLFDILERLWEFGPAEEASQMHITLHEASCNAALTARFRHGFTTSQASQVRTQLMKSVSAVRYSSDVT